MIFAELVVISVIGIFVEAIFGIVERYAARKRARRSQGLRERATKRSS
jgi:ABC-type nitrate/sulfonate/bicarbonate transport system permease component